MGKTDRIDNRAKRNIRFPRKVYTYESKGAVVLVKTYIPFVPLQKSNCNEECDCLTFSSEDEASFIDE